MVMTSLEDTPCPISATEARQKLKKPYQKTKDKNCITLLTLNSAESKTSNIFKIEISQDQKLMLTIKYVFRKSLPFLFHVEMGNLLKDKA